MHLKDITKLDNSRVQLKYNNSEVTISKFQT